MLNFDVYALFVFASGLLESSEFPPETFLYARSYDAVWSSLASRVGSFPANLILLPPIRFFILLCYCFSIAVSPFVVMMVQSI